MSGSLIKPFQPTVVRGFSRYDAEVVLELVGERLEALAVLDGHGGVVDRAWSDHDEQAIILLCDDLCGVLAALENGLLGVCGDGELVGEERGRDQRIVAEDCDSQLARELRLGNKLSHVPRTSSLTFLDSSKEGMSSTFVAGLSKSACANAIL
jgi:hypothetical protein